MHGRVFASHLLMYVHEMALKLVSIALATTIIEREASIIFFVIPILLNIAIARTNSSNGSLIDGFTRQQIVLVC